MASATISGFTVVPIAYGGDSTHYLYARAHTGSKKNSSKTLPDARTLFLVNVPPDATERELVLFFKSSGTVERVVFDGDAPQEELDVDSDNEEQEAEEQQPDEVEEMQPARKRRKLTGKKNTKPTIVPLPSPALRRLRGTGRTAHVVFLDQSSVDRALLASSTPRPWPLSEEPSGLGHYMARYDAARPPLDSVRAHADSAMELFEYELRQTKQQSKYHKGEDIVDEDGFTLVTRGGAYGKNLGGGVGVASKKFQETGETTTRQRKKETKEKKNFYAFQLAERQRNDLLELKKNWELDKAKVEKLKAARKFKPY
ncbi:ribosomal RNA-processing protein 7-domain-containing protein [Mycena amicta]|nr:ribosomal RNA-processing protein 7-domain-containing protein [Mycena amicta]